MIRTLLRNYGKHRRTTNLSKRSLLDKRDHTQKVELWESKIQSKMKKMCSEDERRD
jgi:hypothetical protein